MNLLNFKPLEARQKNSNGQQQNGILSVINSKKNGKRLVLSKRMVDELKATTQLYVITDGKCVIFSSSSLMDNSFCYRLRDGDSGRKILYCAPVVDELSKILNLSFEDCVSKTIADAEFAEDD